MAKKLTSLGSAKRFGTRYGRTLKYKVAEVEALKNKKHQCPYCRKEAVKRIVAGIWECRKCETKFTGKAYSP